MANDHRQIYAEHEAAQGRVEQAKIDIVKIVKEAEHCFGGRMSTLNSDGTFMIEVVSQGKDDERVYTDLSLETLSQTDHKKYNTFASELKRIIAKVAGWIPDKLRVIIPPTAPDDEQVVNEDAEVD